MADLLTRLLENSSSSQLTAILSGYLQTAECKRDAEFYCSLKSVVLSLSNRRELSNETVRQVYRDYCFPTLQKTFPERLALYSVYELIALCCSIGPKDLSTEIISKCLDSFSTYSKEVTSPSGLPVLVCLDLVSYLMKDNTKDLIGGESRVLVFDSLLDLLCKSDELMCARIASILPLFLLQESHLENPSLLMTLWNRIKEMSKIELSSTTSSHGNLLKCYATLCSLIDIFIMDSNPGTSILHDSQYWELIQQGLKLQEPLSSKQAMYLLKRSLDHIEKGSHSIGAENENGGAIFYWESKLNKTLLDVWQDYILLLETLSETQIHVIRPVLTKFSKIVSASESKSGDFQTLHISWLTVIIHKASLHPNRSIRKWAALEVMSMDLQNSPLLYPQNWDFLLGHFQCMVGEHSLYGKNHDGCPGTLSPVGTALHSFYKNCINALPQHLHVKFIEKLIIAIERQKFSAAPLVCVCYSLANIPNLRLLGPESLERVRNILLHLRTHTINLRLATKGFILTTVANLTNPSLVSWDIVFNFLTVGKLDECLQRNSWLWKRLCDWISITEMSRNEMLKNGLANDVKSEELLQFLSAKMNEFFKDKELHEDIQYDEAASLGRIIVAVADVFHSQEGKTNELMEALLKRIFQNFHDAGTRLYMSEMRLRKAVELLTSMLDVLIDGSYENTIKDSCDYTKELITNLLKRALTDILILLQRKLSSNEGEEDTFQNFSFLKLFQTLHRFHSANQSMSSSWTQFCFFLDTITRANIKTVQDLQGNGNHNNMEWSTMHLSMSIIAWTCDVTRDDQLTVPGSISNHILDAIPTFCLKAEFKKPDAVDTTEVSYQGTTQSTAAWRNSMSGYLGALWRTVAYFIQMKPSKVPIFKAQEFLTVTSCSKQVMEAALDALDVASSDNVLTIMMSIGLLIPKLIEQHEELCSHALDMVWATLKEMWESASFWEVYSTTMKVLMSPTLLMLPREHPLTIKIKSRVREMLDEGEFRPGIMNVVVEQLSDVWSGGEVSWSSSVQVYKDLVVEMLLYNASIKKSHVVEAQVDAFLRHDLSPQSPLCALSGLARRDDAQVRVVMTNTLLTLDPTSSSVHQALFEIVQLLLEQDKEISIANAKMYMNSRSHRKKHRAWQAVLVLLSMVLERDSQSACAEEILRYTFASLEDSNQVSVQNFQLWTILCILNRCPHMMTLLWDELQHDSDKRLGRISMLATVVMLFAIHCVPDLTKRASVFKRAISAVFPWVSTNHRHARVHSQVAVQRMWYHCVSENLTHALNEKDFIAPCLEFMATINDTLAEKVKLLENYFFFDFNPIRDFSIETIYRTIPKHSGISEEEWVEPENFREHPVGMHVWGSLLCHGLPLYNIDRRLADFVIEPYNYKESAGVQFQRRFREEKVVAQAPETQDNGISDRGNVQKKIIAWKIVPPDETMMVELQQQRMLSMQKSSGGNLIVVASLIDKAPNLGGLCRTSEIFGVRKLVLGSNEIMKDKDFKNLSVSSSKWVDIEQVRPVDLKGYLQVMQRQGYTLIGVEQTANSKQLTEYTFPHDALLLLGNEKEGIPADLIQLLDVCVEIPQVGVIRSLNVHVSGALLIWEYTRQRVLSI